MANEQSTTTFETGSDNLTVFDAFKPGAKAGTYTLTATQTLTSGGETRKTESHSLRFTIGAPRFALRSGAGDIHSSYPSPGAAGDCSLALPHVVLKSRSLPWERAQAGGGASTPWMALLLLSDAEWNGRRKTLKASQLKALAADETGPVHCPFAGDAPLAIEPSEEDVVTSVVDVDAALFASLCPKLGELHLLAHVRQVDPSSKEDKMLAGHRDFSVVMANRFPQPGMNTAVLVSLEGWSEWLKDAKEPKAGETVRLVALHEWRFENKTDDATFFAQARALDVGMLAVAPSKIAAPESHEAKAGVDAARTALGEGRVPLLWRPEDAAPTLAWYRGPFAPMEVAPLPSSVGVFEHGDSALVADEKLGSFDVSYAAAWNLGRLLAVGSPSYAGALLRWKRARQEDAFAGYDMSKGRSLLEDMERFVSSTAKGSGGALYDDIATITEWLARLRLLLPVPLRYLVPHEWLLPDRIENADGTINKAGSLRFFHVDLSWLDALQEGALSIGIVEPGAQGEGVDRVKVRSALGAIMARQRPSIEGVMTPDGAARIKGLLLRSTLLSRFAGVEVELWKGDKRVAPLRLEQIGADVLLALVDPGTTHAVLKEPREGLRFEAWGEPKKRSLWAREVRKNADGTCSLVAEGPNEEHVSLTYRGRDVLDVGALAKSLRCEDSGASFALHWLRAPRDVRIDWPLHSTQGAEQS